MCRLPYLKALRAGMSPQKKLIGFLYADGSGVATWPRDGAARYTDRPAAQAGEPERAGSQGRHAPLFTSRGKIP
jgi:hypothetical protein